MSARYIIIAAAVIFMAGVLLYLVDHKSLVSAGPQPSTGDSKAIGGQ
jgi:hypothetical protein